jgi:hypothetical protein
MQSATAQNINAACDSIFKNNTDCFEKNNSDNVHLLAYCQDTVQQKKQNVGSKRERKEIREMLEARKREYFKKEMNLTDEDAKVFFPVLNQFESKHRKIEHDRRNLLSDFETRKNTITDAEAKQINKQLFDLQKQEFDLILEYEKIYETILTPKKLFLFHKAQANFMRGLLKSMGSKNKNKDFSPLDFDKKL